MEIVGIAGAGTMGSAISALFANAGYEVVLYDISREALERAKKRNEREHLLELERAGLKKRERLDNIKYTTELSNLRDCDFLLEAIKEDLMTKVDFFRRAKEVCRRALFASNTSSYMPSELSEGAGVNIFLFHFANPPIEMPLVEISGTGDPSKYVEYAQKIGKRPVVLKKQCRGAVLDRMLCVLGCSLPYAVFKLGATPYEIDATAKQLGFRYGLFESLDKIGLDICLAIVRALGEAYPRFSPDAEPLVKFAEEFLVTFVNSGKLGKKSGEGFYRWSGEEPVPEPVERYADITLLAAVLVNEAQRIVDEGIADKETVDEVWKRATLYPAGPFEFAEAVGYEALIERLEEAYEETGAEIFKPVIRGVS